MGGNTRKLSNDETPNNNNKGNISLIGQKLEKLCQKEINRRLSDNKFKDHLFDNDKNTEDFYEIKRQKTD